MYITNIYTYIYIYIYMYIHTKGLYMLHVAKKTKHYLRFNAGNKQQAVGDFSVSCFSPAFGTTINLRLTLSNVWDDGKSLCKYLYVCVNIHMNTHMHIHYMSQCELQHDFMKITVTMKMCLCSIPFSKNMKATKRPSARNYIMQCD